MTLCSPTGVKTGSYQLKRPIKPARALTGSPSIMLPNGPECLNCECVRWSSTATICWARLTDSQRITSPYGGMAASSKFIQGPGIRRLNKERFSRPSGGASLHRRHRALVWGDRRHSRTLVVYPGLGTLIMVFGVVCIVGDVTGTFVTVLALGWLVVTLAPRAAKRLS
jgi:hypothetical protein